MRPNGWAAINKETAEEYRQFLFATIHILLELSIGKYAFET